MVAQRTNFDLVENYLTAIQKTSKQAFPILWAKYHRGLANAWLECTKSDTNLTQAIRAFESAQTVFTADQYPSEWIALQESIVGAWSAMSLNNFSTSMGRIDSRKRLSDHWLIKRTRSKWANIQYEMGLAYFWSTAGPRAENMVTAELAFREALTVFTQQDHPYDWARTCNALANAMVRQTSGDPNKRAERAFVACQCALRVFHREERPIPWAMTQDTLGCAWQIYTVGDRCENLQTAAEHHLRALNECRVYDSILKAEVLNNLNVVLLQLADLLELQQWDLLRITLQNTLAVLGVLNERDHPFDYAQAQDILSHARIAYERSGASRILPLSNIRPAELFAYDIEISFTAD